MRGLLRKVTVSSVNHRDSRLRSKAIDGHRLALPEAHVTTLNGLTVTTAERTWVDCSAVVGEQHLLAMGDWALGAGVLDLEQVNRIISCASGRRGVRRARSVHPLIRTGVESPQESRLRWVLIAAGLPEPEINPTIVIRGRRVARLDLAYRETRLAIEYDGDWHAETVEYDRQRLDTLRSAGWTVLTVHKEDLEKPDRVVNLVRRNIAKERQARRQRW